MRRVLLGMIAGLATAAAHADYYTGFELPNFNGSAAGTSIAGQQGWYTPPVAGSVDGRVHTYGGNVHGIVQNPVGGNQFAVTQPASTSSFARAQYDYPFGSSQYTVSYDIAGVFEGATPSALNLSSFSLNHPTLASGAFRGFIAINNFVDLNNPSAGLKIEFNVFNAGGTTTPNLSPGAAWQNLAYNNWYRQYVTFDLATNLVNSITLVNLHTGASSTVNPQGWYMDGGAGSTLPLPASIRLFGGGNTGNVTGWDNIHIVPAPGSLALLAGAGLLAARRRRS
jgi:hypothetical protein